VARSDVSGGVSTGRKRVLITGAGGFIAGHVLRQAPPEWDLVALSRGHLSVAPHVKALRWSGEPGDDLPPELDAPFDATIHLAGNASHRLAATEPWVDLSATGGIAAAILSGITTRRIVLLSSAAVYGGMEGAVDPAACVEPPMAYGLSKRYVEGLVRTLVTRGSVDSAVTFRLYNAFGPGERPSRLIPSVADAIRRRQAFELSGDASSLSDPVEVGWVAGALLAAVEPGPTGTFDLCGGDPIGLIDQVHRVAAVMGVERLDVNSRPDRDEVPIRFWSDPTPAIQMFRLGNPLPFPDAVRSYARAEGWI
jgi:nucleoside-diphosphate-sugar epimerase